MDVKEMTLLIPQNGTYNTTSMVRHRDRDATWVSVVVSQFDLDSTPIIIVGRTVLMDTLPLNSKFRISSKLHWSSASGKFIQL